MSSLQEWAAGGTGPETPRVAEVQGAHAWSAIFVPQASRPMVRRLWLRDLLCATLREDSPLFLPRFSPSSSSTKLLRVGVEAPGPVGPSSASAACSTLQTGSGKQFALSASSLVKAALPRVPAFFAPAPPASSGLLWALYVGLPPALLDLARVLAPALLCATCAPRLGFTSPLKLLLAPGSHLRDLQSLCRPSHPRAGIRD